MLKNYFILYLMGNKLSKTRFIVLHTIIEKTKKIPRVGEIIYHNDYKFIIEVVDKKRIKQVKLILPK